MRRMLLVIAASSLTAQAIAAPVFGVTNLVTNDQLAHSAQITDAALKNAWGIASSPTGPFWVSDNGTGVSTIYNVDPATNATTKAGLTVTIPGAGSVTGQTFNANSGAGAFNGDPFLFVSEDGTISGWRPALGATAETLQIGSAANVYKGVTMAVAGGNSYLYAANFRAGTIDVMVGDVGAPVLLGNFLDPTLPAGFAPFNIRELGGKLYVTYAKQDATGQDDVPGAGFGYVDAFDLQGNLLARVGTAGTLNSPWGLAIAPGSFGTLAGSLLVGNFGDGRINAYDITTNTFLGQLQDAGGTLAIDGLWALTVGNNGNGGSSDDVYFTAGPDGEANGLVGAIGPVPEPASLALLWTIGAIGLARRRTTLDGE